MGNKVSVSEECLSSILSVLQKARGGLEDAVLSLKRAYSQASSDWNDKKYQQLGDIVEKASRSILVIGSHLGSAKEKVKKLQEAVVDYINTGAAQNSANSNAYYRQGESSARNIDSILNDFKDESWATKDEATRKANIRELSDYVINDLGLTNPPSINYYYREPDEDGTISCGFYRPGDNSININTYTMDDSRETADTVAHEMRHAWQRQRAANPQTDEDRAFANNLRPGNYIRHEVNPLGYYRQPVERDARQYAEGIVRRI